MFECWKTKFSGYLPKTGRIKPCQSIYKTCLSICRQTQRCLKTFENYTMPVSAMKTGSWSSATRRGMCSSFGIPTQCLELGSLKVMWPFQANPRSVTMQRMVWLELQSDLFQTLRCLLWNFMGSVWECVILLLARPKKYHLYLETAAQLSLPEKNSTQMSAL